MNKKHLITLGLTAITVVSMAGAASAQNHDRNDDRGRGMGDRMKAIGELKTEVRGLMRPELVGKVTAVNGSTLSVTGKTFGANGSASTTFTVNTSGAVIVKGGSTSTVSAIGVGDVIVVQGAVNGSVVTATQVHSGVRANDDKKHDKPNKPEHASTTTPVLVGKVTAVSTTTLTVVNKANATFTVNASNAVIKTRDNATSTISNIAVGDNVVAKGTVNGSTVTATTIVDHDGNTVKDKKDRKWFLNGLGNWFKSIFKF